MAEIEIGAAYWRKYAVEARHMADEMTSDVNVKMLLRIAAQYDKLADDAEKRETPRKPSP